MRYQIFLSLLIYIPRIKPPTPSLAKKKKDLRGSYLNKHLYKNPSYRIVGVLLLLEDYTIEGSK